MICDPGRHAPSEAPLRRYPEVRSLRRGLLDLTPPSQHPRTRKEAPVTISRNPLRALQKAGYRCQARTVEGYGCGAKAGQVDRATGVVVCREHLTRRA